MSERKLSGTPARVARALALVLPVLTLWCAFSGWWDAMTRAAGHLMIAVPLVFLYYPARAFSQGRVTRLDWLFAVSSFAAFCWIVVSQKRLMWRLVYVDPLTWPDLILGMVAIAVVLEGTRRILGWSLIVTTGLFLLYAVAGPLMPGPLAHQGVRLELLIDHLYLVPEGLFNVLTGIMATYLFTFLTFASLLQAAGGDRIVMDLAAAIGGRFVGGPAKVAVMASALMGMVSGSTTANVVTTGSITIPLMKRYGFRPVEAAAIETASGVGGAIMPPIMGAGVFIMAELTGIPLLTILLYSILPAALYFASVFAYVHVKATQLGLTATSTEAGPPVRSTLGKGIHLLVPLAILVGMLATGYTPFYASSLTVVLLVGISYLRRETRLTPARLLDAFERTTRGALMLSLTSAAAAIIMGVITSTGLMLKITSLTLTLAQGSLLLGIVLVGLISLIVGLGLPVTMSYILVSTLAAPALGELGATLLTAHLVIFWFAQDSTITPPVCNTAFVAASIAGAPPMRTGWESLRVAKGLYLIPILLVYSNLLSGNLPLMLYDAFAGMLGLALVPAVTSGYLRGPLSPPSRVLLALGAASFFGASFLTSLAASAPWMVGGLLLGGGVYLNQRRQESALAALIGNVAVSAPAAKEENS
jgi:TRAP transporter 4TM/12TM fusion protein